MDDVTALVERLRYASRMLHATDPEHTREWEDCGWGDCVKDRAAIAAVEARAALTPERLAKALHHEELCWDGVDECVGPEWHGEAARILAALATQS